MDLFEGSITCFWEEEDREDDEDGVGAEPDVAVFGTPTELGGIDKVRCGESPEPVTNKVKGSG